jgi:predicted site-specific integrase-resolvase
MRALLKWLRHHDLTPAQFADCLGVNRALVHRWVNEGAIPTPDKMRALYRFTHGEVAPNDFYDLPRIRRTRTIAGPAVLETIES